MFRWVWHEFPAGTLQPELPSQAVLLFDFTVFHLVLCIDNRHDTLKTSRQEKESVQIWQAFDNIQLFPSSLPAVFSISVFPLVSAFLWSFISTTELQYSDNFLFRFVLRLGMKYQRSYMLLSWTYKANFTHCFYEYMLNKVSSACWRLRPISLSTPGPRSERVIHSLKGMFSLKNICQK